MPYKALEGFISTLLQDQQGEDRCECNELLNEQNKKLNSVCEKLVQEAYESCKKDKRLDVST